jgi:pterin-4a-carbinolamine dehydratase
MSETIISSFVVRFVQDRADQLEHRITGWRGLITHVQTEEEQQFTRFAEAVAFMARFVDLGKSDPMKLPLPDKRT